MKIINKIVTMWRLNKTKKLQLLTNLILVTVICLSIGYSAFGVKVNIANIITDVRIKKDVRISGVSVSSENNNTGISRYEDYNINSINVGIELPNEDSSITYKVNLINLGNVEVGLYSINNVPSNIKYKVTGMNLKEKICDSNNKCSLGIEKEFYITFYYAEEGYNSNNINYDLSLEFDFRRAYTVTYEGITNNGYTDNILEGDTLEVTFTSPIPPKVVPYINDVKVNNYTYENNKITVPNVTDNIILRYIDKVYLASLPESTYFKTSDYLTKIKTISFVDNMDVPTNALATYNLEQNSGTEIKGWIDTNYNLYIGSEWDIYATNFEDAFMGMTGVTSINFDNLDTSEVTTFYNTFNGMSNLETIDVSGFNTSSATTMRNMFNGLSKVTTLDVSGFDTTKVTNMVGMFKDVAKVGVLDVSNFNTSKVTNMFEMFSGMTSLTTLDVSGFNTSLVTNMQSMFNNLKNVTELDVANFNTSNVTNMWSMFYNMSSLTSLDVSNFNTGKVTDMGGMFYNLNKLTELDVSNFNTSKVKYMWNVFANMTSLTSLDLSGWDTSQVTRMDHMFRKMPALVKLDLTSFNTSNVTNMFEMFNHSSGLTEILVSNKWVVGTNTNITDMFVNCGVSGVTLKT